MPSDQQALMKALKLLASPAAAQVVMLPELRRIAEELRGGVVDIVRIDQKLARTGRLPAELARCIGQIDAIIEEVLDKPEAWTEAGLERDEAWARIRAVANEALGIMTKR